MAQRGQPGDGLGEDVGRQEAAYQHPLAARCGAAHARQRAERLGGGHRVVRPPAAQHRPGVAGDVGTDPAAQRRHLVLGRRVRGEPVAAEPARAQRQGTCKVGGLVRAGGDLQGAAADVEDRETTRRPAEPAAYRQEGQPRLVLARQYLDAHPGHRAHVLEHRVGVGRVAHRRRGEAQHLLAALVLGDLQRVGDERGQRVDPWATHRTGGVQVLGQAQRRLVGVRRHRRGTAMRVDHQQVARVGTDVEHAQPHAPYGTRRDVG